MDKKMEHDMETGVSMEIYGLGCMASLFGRNVVM